MQGVQIKEAQIPFASLTLFCAIDDSGLFGNYCHEIHPPGLEFFKKNEHGGERVSFLDLDIKTANKQLLICPFGKRDVFSFSIVNCQNIIPRK